MMKLQMTRLDNIVSNVTSWNPVRDGGEKLICYVDLSSIDQENKTIESNQTIIAREAPSRARQLIKKGDILVSTVRPNLNGVAIVDESLDGATASTGFCVLRPNREKIDNSYLFHWVKTPDFISDMVRQATGASYPAVSDRIIMGSKIPLPPIEQQKRIAAILDKAEELRRLRRQSIEHLDVLSRSIFIEIFGDPVTNPKYLPVLKLGKLTKIGTGGTPSRKKSEHFEGNIPWVKTTEVNSYLITDTEEKITEIALKNSNCSIYPVGSIIIAMYGQGKTRGQCAVLGIEASTNQACAVLLPNLSYRTNFLFAQIAMSYSRLRSIARGGNQENLNLSLIADFEVLLPSLDLQDKFAQRIETIESLKAKHRESLTHRAHLEVVGGVKK